MTTNSHSCMLCIKIFKEKNYRLRRQSRFCGCLLLESTAHHYSLRTSRPIHVALEWEVHVFIRWPGRANFIYNPQFTVHHLHCAMLRSTIHNPHCAIRNLHCAMCDRQSTIHIVQCAIDNPQSTLCNVQSTIHNLHCAMCDRQSTIHLTPTTARIA